MSRIGKQPIELPSGVDLTIDAGKAIVKGPLGTLTVPIPPHANVEVKADPREVVVTVEKEDDPETVPYTHTKVATVLRESSSMRRRRR